MYKTALFVFTINLLFLPGLCTGQSQEFNDLPLKELERQLNAILQTRLPEEKKYIAGIVELVGKDKIPRSLVNASFKYVRNRRPYAKNRFVYFVRVLQFLGKREKIAIPEFDFKIYSTTPRQRLSK